MFKIKKYLTRACCLLAIATVPAFSLAADANDGSEWEFGGAVYLWAADLSVKTPRGRDATIPFDTLLDNLSMAFMGAVEARKDRWSLFTDIIYMDINKKAKQHQTGPGGNPIEVRGNVGMESWIINAQTRYAVHDTDQARISLVGGLRYLNLDLATGLRINDQPLVDLGDSGSNWDVIVGAHGEFQLNDKWFVPVYADIGTGDSKSTWQGMGGVGYRFSKLNVLLTYRYLSYKIDDSPLIGKMTVSGPMLGASFRFR
jgi:opacity protein-like surface antigen